VILKGVKDLIEELVESLEHTHSVEDMMHDVEPPESFALFELRRVGHGKHRRGSFVERTANGLRDIGYRVWPLAKPKLNSMLKIHLRHRPMHMKQGIGSVKKYDSYRTPHIPQVIASGSGLPLRLNAS
jgi:hypothetical protein